MLTAGGYRVIAPDYRGAGESSKSSNGYTKASMAADLIMLLDTRQVEEKFHVVGHNIGGQIAFAMASRWPNRVASLCVCECLLPGTEACQGEYFKHSDDLFHHGFHRIPNLPESLIAGKERIYLEYFINKMCYRIGAIPPRVVDRYVEAYSQPGAMRCALDLYRAFEKDSTDHNDWMKTHGKITVPTLALCGENSSYAGFMRAMVVEVVAGRSLRIGVIRESGHFVPEEQPLQLADALLELANQCNDT